MFTDIRRPVPVKKLNNLQIKFIDNCMAENDKLTSRQVRGLLVREWPDIDVSISTIKRIRKQLGWIPTRPKYCQLIRV